MWGPIAEATLAVKGHLAFGFSTSHPVIFVEPAFSLHGTSLHRE